DEYFESSRPGVHIVGELGGMGLIKNAVTQGLQVAERLAQTMPRGSGSSTDVVIVGAGPAGLAAALRLREAGRTFRVLEQGTPRKLGCRGEALPSVTYRMRDPEQYEGCGVLVVGGGDAALEAAMQLAEESDARVSISYRGENFAKCREKNRTQMAEMVNAGR